MKDKFKHYYLKEKGIFKKDIILKTIFSITESLINFNLINNLFYYLLLASEAIQIASLLGYDDQISNNSPIMPNFMKYLNLLNVLNETNIGYTGYIYLVIIHFS